MSPSEPRVRSLALALAILAGVTVGLTPAPTGVDPRAWVLFGIFVATILTVLLDAAPILAAAALALPAAVLTGSMTPAEAYAGFSEGVLLLILLAFLVARCIVKTGLGRRLAFAIVARFGGSTLGLGYSIFVTDALIAPAFPSNTARSSVLYPIAYSLALEGGSRPDDGTQGRMGAYLMFCGMASVAVSSTLWLTAMAANPLGAHLARGAGVPVTFGSWFLSALPPSVVAILLLPRLLLVLLRPEVTATPQAPAAAREALRQMGPLSRHEALVGLVFLGLVLGWAFAGRFGLDPAAVAFLGLGVLMVGGVFTPRDLAGEGQALGTFLWFGVLFALSAALANLGFMSWAGAHLADRLLGLPWPAVYVLLLASYVGLHYFFVSQTAHLMALYGVFLGVGLRTGVPAPLLAFGLLFATNYFSALTPQASSANVLFAGSGYLTQRDLYGVGALVTLALFAIYVGLGTPWLLLLWGRG